MVVGLTAKQRRELERVVARATESAQVVRRAHVVLWSADGVSGAEIARRLHLSAEAVSRIRRRFVETGVAGLATRPKAGRKDHAVPEATIARVVDLAMSPPVVSRQEVEIGDGALPDVRLRDCG
jgi:hypothetical protein